MSHASGRFSESRGQRSGVARIDDLCDQFEQLWEERSRPQLENFLEEVGGSQRQWLLKELLLIELWWRKSRGEFPQAAEYLSRFATDQRIVNEAFAAGGGDSKVNSVPQTIDTPGASHESSTQDYSRPSSSTPGDDEFPETLIAPRCNSEAPLPNSSASAAGVTHSRRLGDYELLGEIARGGMGIVYRARQLSLNRIVALKMIRAGELAGDEDVRRFRIEAEAAAKLDHPAIVPVYEVGEVEGQHFFSMGFVEGRSLSKRLVEGPLAPRQAAELLLVITEAMQYAHSQGVIHRDLKPGNILLIERDPESNVSAGSQSSGSSKSRQIRGASQPTYTPKITDFGLAKQTQADSELTSTGQILGTPSFMPPEQARGSPDIGPAADVYSLGAVLYAMLTGRPPFQSATVLETIRQVIEQEPVPVSRLNPAIDRDLETICLKCLQKSPDRRYAAAADLADDLRRYLNREPITARPVSRAERVWRWCRRKPAAATAIAAAGATVVAVVVLAFVGLQLRLSQKEVESRKLRLTSLEAESKLRDVELQNQKKLAAVQKYYALLSGARERTRESNPGWAIAGLEDIRAAAALSVDTADAAELRSEAARFLTGVDIRQVAKVEMGQACEIVAFHPEGKQFALAAFKDWFVLRVVVCRVPDGSVAYRLTAPTAKGWQLRNNMQDAISGLKYSADGNKLSIQARSGWLHQWDLTKSPPELKSYEMPADLMNSEEIIAPTGNWLVTAPGRSRVELWRNFANKTTLPILDAGHVNSIDVSYDSRRIAVAVDPFVYLLDAQTGRTVRKIDHAGFVTRFSRDARLVAVGTSSAIVLVDTGTGMVIQELRDPTTHNAHTSLYHLDFSPTGTLLVSCGGDQKIKVWDVYSGKMLLSVFVGGSDTVCAEFSPDERYLATTGVNCGFLYELNGSSCLRVMAGQPREVSTFDGVENMLVVASAEPIKRRRRLSAWDAVSGKELECWQDAGDTAATSLALSADGERLAIADSRENSIKIVDFHNSISSHPAPDELYPVLLFRGEQFVRVDLESASIAGSPEQISKLGLPWNRIDAALNWGDGTAYFFHDDECVAWNIAHAKIVEGYPQKTAIEFPGVWQTGPLDAAFTACDDFAYFVRGDECIRVGLRDRQASRGFPKPLSREWKTAFEDRISSALDYSDVGGEMTFLREGEYVSFNPSQQPSATAPQPITKWIAGLPWDKIDAAVDLAPRRLPVRLLRKYFWNTARQPALVHLTRDGKGVWGTSGSEIVSLWSSDDLREVFQWNNKMEAMLLGRGAFTTFAAGRPHLVAGTSSGQVLRFPIAGGNPHPVWATTESVTSLAITADETLSVIGTINGEVYQASLPRGERHELLGKHRDMVTSVAVADSGQLFATASRDQTIRLWTLRDKSCVLALTLYVHGPVEKACFVNGGNGLVALVKGEHALRMWNLQELRGKLSDISLNW